MNTLIAQTIDIQSRLQSSGSIQFDLGTILESFAGALLIIAGVITFFYMLWGGLDWILAGGEKGKIEEARKKITQGIVGLGVVASVFAVFGIVQYFLGIPIIEVAR